MMEQENLVNIFDQQETTPQQEPKKTKKEKFSYSKIGVFEGCKYKYKLVYRDHHFIKDDSVATEFGTLIHYIEETMARKIIDGEKLNSQELISLLYNADIHNDIETVRGVNILKQLYPEQWMELDKSNRTYQDKINEYCNNGIFRLYSFLMNNPQYEIVGVEEPFDVGFRDYTFHGFIDRVFRNKDTGEIYIEDIKTWNKPAEEKDLKTPLQFVVYSLAAQKLYNVSEDMIHCAYELPLCDIKQPAGSKGYMTRGIKKLNSLFDEIETGDFEPSPSPLCHWCIFSATKPNQPEEAKGLCPYFSHWTKEKKDFSVETPWMGAEQHEEIAKSYMERIQLAKQMQEEKARLLNLASQIQFTNSSEVPTNGRRLLIRRR